MNYFVHESSFVDQPCQIGEGTRIWHFCHVMKDAVIGERCSFGQNVAVHSGVTIGNNVKVQNNVSIYEGTQVDDDVFLGPSCVLTNISNPRSQIVRKNLYEKTWIRKGATIGANSTIVCGHTIGRYAFIAAGAVVTKNIPDYAFMAGVPAKRIGWMSRHGHPLKDADSEGVFTCPESKFRYKQIDENTLKCLDLDEDADLPENMRQGNIGYRELKNK